MRRCDFEIDNESLFPDKPQHACYQEQRHTIWRVCTVILMFFRALFREIIGPQGCFQGCFQGPPPGSVSYIGCFQGPGRHPIIILDHPDTLVPPHDATAVTHWCPARSRTVSWPVPATAIAVLAAPSAANSPAGGTSLV